MNGKTKSENFHLCLSYEVSTTDEWNYSFEVAGEYVKKKSEVKKRQTLRGKINAHNMFVHA